jgi:hypothetical protein
MANPITRAINYLRGRSPVNGDGTPVQLATATDDLIRQEVWGTTYGPSGGNLSNETPAIRQRYNEMFREPMVKIGVVSKVWDVAAQNLSCVPQDKADKRQVQIAEFNTDNVQNAKGGVLAIVESLLFGALKDGYGVSHRKKRDEDRGKWTGKRVLAELRPKDSDYYDLIYDPYRNLQWVKEKYPRDNDPTEGYHKPAEFVVTYHMRIFDSPWGMSDFRAADRAYCCKDAATRLRMIYLDKYAGPFVTAESADSNVKGDLLSELKQLRAGGVAVVPPGTELKILETAMSGAEAFAKAIADWNEEITGNFSLGFLQTLASQVTNASGKSSEHANTAKIGRWYLAQLVCNAVNDQIIPDATDENFSGTPPYPKAVISGLDPDFVLKDLEVAAMMMDLGCGLDEDEIHERGGWRKGDFKKAPVPIPATLTAAAQDVAGVGAGAAPGGKAAPNGKPPPAAGTGRKSRTGTASQ